ARLARFVGIAVWRLSPPGLGPRRAVSSRNNADAAGEWFGHCELAVDNLERKRRQGAGGGTVHRRRALARIVVRIMTRALKNLLRRHPTIDFATGVRTNRRIGNDAVGPAILR